MKYLLSVVFFIAFSFTSNAQNARVTGVIIDSISGEPVGFASVTNLDKKNTKVATSKGYFHIDVSVGDMLSFASVNHYHDTLVIKSKMLNDTIIIVLKPITKALDEVTVVATINRYQYDSTQRRKVFLKDVGVRRKTISNANSGAGVGINLDRFSKKEKNKRKAYDLFEMLEKNQYINYRFSPNLVMKYSTLRGESLYNFINEYCPSYEWLRAHTTEEDMKYYINDKLKLYHNKK